MTSEKRFKRLVRQRMTRNGENYATARRHLMAKNEEATMHEEMTTISEPGWGFSLSCPASWERLPGQSSKEVLRVAAPPAGRPFLAVDKRLLGDQSLDDYAEWMRGVLHTYAVATDGESRVSINGNEAVRFDYRQQDDARTRGDLLYGTAYLFLRAPAGIRVNMWTLDAQSHRELVDQVGPTIRMLPSG